MSRFRTSETISLYFQFCVSFPIPDGVKITLDAISPEGRDREGKLAVSGKACARRSVSPARTVAAKTLGRQGSSSLCTSTKENTPNATLQGIALLPEASAEERRCTLPVLSLDCRDLDKAPGRARSVSEGMETLVDSVSQLLAESPHVPRAERVAGKLTHSAASTPSNSPRGSPTRNALRVPQTHPKPNSLAVKSSLAASPPVSPKPKLSSLSTRSKAPPVSPKPYHRDPKTKTFLAASPGVACKDGLRLDVVRRSLSAEPPDFKSLHLPPTSHEPDGITSPRIAQQPSFPKMKVDSFDDGPPKPFRFSIELAELSSVDAPHKIA